MSAQKKIGPRFVEIGGRIYQMLDRNDEPFLQCYLPNYMRRKRCTYEQRMTSICGRDLFAEKGRPRDGTSIKRNVTCPACLKKMGSARHSYPKAVVLDSEHEGS